MVCKFHVYALHWNEKHLLEHFFKHYNQADHIYIIDNMSDDGSLEIIKKYENVTVIPFDTKGNLDDILHSQMKSNLWKKYSSDCDFVIIQDLDEFVFFPKYPNNIRAGLEDFKKRGITLCKSKGYHMFCSDDDFINVKDQYLTSALYNGNINPFLNMYDKVQIFSPKEINYINYTPGAHSYEATGNIVIDNISVLLLHYKYIGRDFLFKRSINMRERLRNSGGAGVQYKKSDEDTKKYIYSLYDNYGNTNIFQEMYNIPNIAAITYRNKRFILDTYGVSDILSSTLLNNKIWEPNVANIIHDLCSKDNTYFIDIGCNIGAHSAIAKIAGAKKVISFECNPTTYSLFLNSIKLNGWSNIDLHNIALSDKEGILPFKIVDGNIGASYIPTTHIGWVSKTTDFEGGIKATSFDKLNVDLSDASNIILKINIVGHELNALSGMTSLLSNNKLKSIIIEVNPFCSRLETISQIFELLNAYGLNNIKLLFKVPGNDWDGYDSNDITYSDLSLQDIFDMFNNKVICEVLVSR
jgi:FkbM family methyltransferase